jgi:hypothetical protein
LGENREAFTVRKFPDTFKGPLMINVDRRLLAGNHRLGAIICTWAGLGVLLLFLLSVLAGCGSDSTPSSGVKDKAIPSQTKKLQKEPTQDNRGARDLVFEVKPGMPMKEMVKQAAAAAKKVPDPNAEVFPGVTLRQVQAKQAAVAKKQQDPNLEVFPGMTLRELQAKMVKANKPPNPDLEIAPGLTLSEVRAKQAAAARKMTNSPPELFPGVTSDEINAKQKAAQQNIKDLRVMDVFPQGSKP